MKQVTEAAYKQVLQTCGSPQQAIYIKI